MSAFHTAQTATSVDARQALQIDAIAADAPRIPAPSFLYRLGLAAVAVVMVLLPLFYIALIGAVAWGTFWHAVNAIHLFDTMHTKLATVAYVGPLLGGCILIFFMLKPLLASRGSAPGQIALSAKDYPLLWDFVRNICHAMKAPVPSAIEVDISVNASASFRRGWRSLFSNDLRLVIGLPLVYGMEARQLGGILAHEFGHFSQGAGMRFGYVVGSINSWFAYVVYGRDAWDERLEGWAQSNGWSYAGILLHIARFFVWLSRRVLWVLMMVGHAASCFSSRQMEYDADLRAIFFAGSDEFERTFNRVQELAVAENMAMQIASDALKEKKLPLNLSKFVTQRADTLDEATKLQIREMSAAERKSAFSTHPATQQRIKAAHKVANSGYYHCAASATLLFGSIDALSEEASKVFYANNGLPLRGIAFVPGESLLDAVQAHGSDITTFASVFGEDGISILRPLSGIGTGGHPVETGKALSYADAVADYQQKAKDAEATIKAFDDAVSRHELAVKAGALLRAGFKIQHKNFGLPKADIDTAKEQTAAIGREIAKLRTALKPLDAAAGTVINAALVFPSTDEQVEQSRTAAVQFLQETAPLHAELMGFLEGLEKVSVLLENAQKENSRRFMEALQIYVERTGGHRQKLLAALGKNPYPFGGPGDSLTVREVLTPSVDSDAEWLNREIHCINHFWQEYPRLYWRCVGRVLDAAGDPIATAGKAS